MRWRDRLVSERGLTVELSLLAIVCAVLIAWQDSWASLNLLLIPMVIGSLILTPRTLSWFVIGILALELVSVSQVQNTTPKTVSAIAVVFLLGLIVLLTAFRRARLGVGGVQGETMFVDLRDRILRQASIPQLPPGWLVESALTSAGGTLFAGDFILAERSHGRLEVVLVDVSGKGEQAGTRALLLCGALGGLLGSVPPAGFLPAANDYLLRQEWDEGFATAVHLSVDLATGDYELRTAGHPPALRRLADDSWVRLETSGPFLGLVEDPEYDGVTGNLVEGGAVMLYTDGVVEEPGRDIDAGIDLLAGVATAQMEVDLVGAAQRLVDRLGARNDDRTMVVVHRL
ncbi:MAG: PP2C family protein-serine/threonine phosphatase [Nocardioides sp.]|uniref:PP2C family protein-serine/threonine phosphatase n=1 Tax=Nocardioides sp. TaxID=35761 RepID=UPI0039E272BE